MFNEDEVIFSDFEKITSINSPWIVDSDKKILITGSTGLIGCSIVKYLDFLNKKYNTKFKITILARSLEKAMEKFGNCNVEYMIQDICSEINTEEQFDFIINCASNADPKLYASNPVETIDTNVLGTINLLEYCKKRSPKTRVIFLSSVEVYGITSFDRKLKESDFGYIDCNTLRACYTESKRLSETLCKAYYEEYDVNTLIARLCKIYGPYITDTDSKVMAQMMRKVIENENIILKSDGMQKLSFCYSIDVVSALLTILYKGKLGEAYNVSDKNSIYYLKEIAYMMAQYYNIDVEYHIPTEIEKKGYTVIKDAILDSEKLEQLGWKPQVEMCNGIKNSIEYLKTKKKIKKI